MICGVNCNLYNNKPVFCLILARGGSKGVPRKNIKKIAGKPLIVHSIEIAKKVNYIDDVFVSTEDIEIKRITEKSLAKIIHRPEELATDTASYLDTVKHAIEYMPNKESNPIIVLLETTLPIRETQDVKNCIEMLTSDVDCVSSINEVKTSPSYMYKIIDDLLVPHEKNQIITNRQQMEKLFAYNGSILVTTYNFIKNQKHVVFGGRMKGYLLDALHSIDIDTPLDFVICEFLLLNKNQNN